jgi:hypothetical protein
MFGIFRTHRAHVINVFIHPPCRIANTPKVISSNYCYSAARSICNCW